MPVEVLIAEGQTPPLTRSLSSVKTAQGGTMSGMRHCVVLLVFGTTLSRSGWKPAADDVTWEWE